VSVLNTVLTGLGSGDTLGGVVTRAVGDVAGDATSAVADTGLNAIAGWVLNGTRAALQEVAGLIGEATSPNLTGSWFSSTYWRVASLAALLTVPFVFAAMIQALLRSDLALVGKVAFAYLPVSLLTVSLAAPVTMLLLAATDQMCTAVSSVALEGGARFLDKTALAAAGLSTVDGSPFFAVMIGLFTVAAALMLALELLIREAAVYVVVLMLPLAFAAFVWPARRIWAIRLVELLISLILSKFVIVAVLSLAGSAFDSNGGGVSQLLTAMALVLLSTFAPWALLRILPFTELAAGAGAVLRHELPQIGSRAASVAVPGAAGLEAAGDAITALPGMMRRQADAAGQGYARESDLSQPTAQTDAQGTEPSTGPRDAPIPDPQSSPDAHLTEPQSPAAHETQTPPPPRVHPLAHLMGTDNLLDLSNGRWIKPDDEQSDDDR
jgi:hypothetical protein